MGRGHVNKDKDSQSHERPNKHKHSIHPRKAPGSPLRHLIERRQRAEGLAVMGRRRLTQPLLAQAVVQSQRVTKNVSPTIRRRIEADLGWLFQKETQAAASGANDSGRSVTAEDRPISPPPRIAAIVRAFPRATNVPRLNADLCASLASTDSTSPERVFKDIPSDVDSITNWLRVLNPKQVAGAFGRTESFMQRLTRELGEIVENGYEEVVKEAQEKLAAQRAAALVSSFTGQNLFPSVAAPNLKSPTDLFASPAGVIVGRRVHFADDEDFHLLNQSPAALQRNSDGNWLLFGGTQSTSRADTTNQMEFFD